MPPLPNLQQIRDTIRKKVMSENLAKQSNGDDKPLHNALSVVPESSMWNLVNWLENDIIPKVELHRGKDSPEYVNYVAVRDAVIWSLYICNAHEKLLVKIGQDRQKLGYYVKQNAYLESELLKYTTAEQLFSADALAVYRQSVVSRALSIIKNEKK